MKSSHILGMNARNYLYLSRYNTRRGKAIADSKIRTKRLLRKHRLPHPRLLAYFREPSHLAAFDWSKLTENFVVKPAAGYAGEGILLVRKRINSPHPSDDVRFQLLDGSVIFLDDLRFHVLDILEGRYNRYDLPSEAIIEERVKKHRRFKRYAYRGTPDIRIIVFNKVPVMAALRLPTPESRGRANIHQGAIMAGIDLATGITTRAAHWDRPIRTVPGTKLKLNGLKIPYWDEMLALAVNIQEIVPLGYFAVDFLIDPDHGPVIVELTARPGMGIQIANMAGLRRRLERVEGLDIAPGKGIEVAKALFAERFADKVIAERGQKIISVFETAKLRDAKGEKHEISAKLDTGAFRSSIDRQLATDLGLLGSQTVLWHDTYVSALGRQQRPIIPLTFWLAGRKVETAANVSDRGKLPQKLLVGRRDLSTFVIKVNGV